MSTFSTSRIGTARVVAGTAESASVQLLSFGVPIPIPMDAFGNLGAVESYPESMASSLPTDVAALLVNYSARSSPERIRPAITAFVRLAVIAVAPQNRFTFEQATAPVARLANWAHGTRAFPLLPKLLFSPEVLGLFIAEQLASGDISAGTVRNYKAHVARIGVALGLGTEFALAPIQRDQETAPYTEDEILGIRLWARGRSSLRARTRAEMILALIAGAGLRNEEVLALRARDVIVSGETWIRVRGDHDRLVPVQPEWRPLLRKRLEESAPDEFVYPDAGKVPTGHLTAWLRSVQGAPQAQRLRTTWIIQHLEDRTDLPSLLAWAGIERGESLIRYLPYLSGPVDRALHLKMMRTRLTAP